MIRVKGSESGPFIFIYRSNIVQHNSYQGDEIIMEIEEWKQNLQTIMSKALEEIY